MCGGGGGIGAGEQGAETHQHAHVLEAKVDTESLLPGGACRWCQPSDLHVTSQPVHLP